MINKSTESDYWKIRSEKYNNLKWVSDKSCMENLIGCLDIKDDDTVLDVGTGTGIVASNIKNMVSSVFALDISNDMLSKGKWQGVSIIEWDVRKPLFRNMIFDKVVARMVFHHILENIEEAFNNCYDCLKDNGKMIIAEAVPPSNSDLVVKWFTDMFSHKEDRITFVPGQLEKHMADVGFLNIESHFFSMTDFSINNWIESSGLPQDKIDLIIQMHLDAPQEVKDAYNMKIDGSNVLIDSKYTIVVGEK